MKHAHLISKDLQLSEKQVETTIELLQSGATVPFIARYRKDQTSGLDEVQILAIEKQMRQLAALGQRRTAIFKSLKERDLLSAELEEKLLAATDLPELEDIYLPFKPKKQSRAEKAKAAGLEPLAKMIMAQGEGDPEKMSKSFIKGTISSGDEALSGAGDIIAEWMNEHPVLRRKLRALFFREGVVASTVIKGKDEEGRQYSDYFSYKEPVNKIKPHRILAVFRAEDEGIVRLSFTPDRKRALDLIEQFFVRNNSPSGKFVKKVIPDAYTRLLRPAMQTEVKNSLKTKAEDSAISVFVGNLRQLLLAPPLGKKRVLAIDPGFRSGCKVVALNENGDLLGHDTIFPHAPQKKTNQARNTIHSLIKTHNIEAIAIGNGTAGRETEDLIKRTEFKRELEVYMVNEDGASVYSASSVGRAEFPNHDVTIRGAVSIGRRLMDPLAELVKIDPRSIGVGQYQHDVDEQKLKSALDQCIQLVVNDVGVELNTASPYLLAHISGLGPGLADKIVKYRSENGDFNSRKELLSVSGLGAKAFEQCAGFLRISGADNPLDNTAVHPESYGLVKKIAGQLKVNIEELINNDSLLEKTDTTSLIAGGVGEYTLTSVLEELRKPNRDPRRTAYTVEFNRKITHPDDLEIGSQMWGVVTNITQFGAFVDIGVKQDGLVHISELADRFVSDPFEVVRINQPVKVKVLSVDQARKRIALSMKQADILKPPVDK